jgi:ubiquinone/menaquinone biosynthesis C-methylase UbiE
VKNYNKKVLSYYKDKASTMKMNPEDHYFQVKRQILKSFCAKESVVLDAGCGNGNFGLLISRDVSKLYGCDFTEEMLEAFKIRTKDLNLSNVYLAKCDLLNLPYSNEIFDMIFSFSTLYYIKEIDTVLSEFNRVLKKNGVMILEFATKYSVDAVHSKIRFKCPQFFLNTLVINKLIREKGFVILEKRYFYLIPGFIQKGWLMSLMGKKINNKTINEIISSLPLLNFFAMKNILIVKKQNMIT